MATNLARPNLLIFSIFFILSACVSGEPYVHQYNEFDRENPNFAKTNKNGSVVEICYNKQSTTPKNLTKLAKKKCKRFGKNAIFVGNQVLKCSIASPATATFACVPEK